MSSPRPITLGLVLRRLALWTVVCAVSAAPSFALASSMGRTSVAGMVAGVSVFVVAYTALTSTRRFERLYRRPFVRDTMYVGYGLRLAMSALATLAWGGEYAILILPDMVCGMISTTLTNAAGLGVEMSARSGAPIPPHPFVGAFVTTCVQGALLNVVVGVVMGIAYVAQRLFRKPPPDDDHHRGFEVVPIT